MVLVCAQLGLRAIREHSPPMGAHSPFPVCWLGAAVVRACWLEAAAAGTDQLRGRRTRERQSLLGTGREHISRRVTCESEIQPGVRVSWSLNPVLTPRRGSAFVGPGGSAIPGLPDRHPALQGTMLPGIVTQNLFMFMKLRGSNMSLGEKTQFFQ